MKVVYAVVDKSEVQAIQKLARKNIIAYASEGDRLIVARYGVNKTTLKKILAKI